MFEQFLNLMHRGGPLMWPLLILSVLTLASVLESLTALWRLGAIGRRGRIASGLIERGMISELIERVPSHASVRVLKSVAASADCEAAASEAAGRVLGDLSRRASFLDTAVTLAPLLGLLGTVTGLISSFGLLGADQLGAPAAVTGGIAESLIATSFGLGLAILALVPLNFLNSKIEELRFEIESAVNKLRTAGGPGVKRAA